MASSSQAAVTPTGIRDGEPAALAALVERRANAVLAYCEAVCPPGVADQAAAEAFARFRGAVATAQDARSLDPEVLLLGATRHAAAAMTPTPAAPAPAAGLRHRLGGARGTGASEVCALVPHLLAARATAALGPADLERLAKHLERHAACRELAGAFARAEQAYAAPPTRTVPIGALTEIMLALAAAAPITAAQGDDLDYVTVEAPEPEVGPEPEVEDLAVVVPAPVVEDEAEPLLEPAAIAEEDPFDPEEDADLHEHEGAVTALVPAVGPDEAEDDPHEHTLVLPAGAVAATSGAGGVPHPRPPRRHLGLPASSGEHGLVYRYVLPGAFVAAAILGALGLTGFFADADVPARQSGTLAAPPAGAPPVTPETDVEAEERSALAAQRRARRERAAAAARERRERAIRAATAAEAEPTSTGTTPAATVPAPAPTPEPRATPDPDPAPRSPPRTAPREAEKAPAEESSSALPETGAETTPAPADPGVFEPAPAPTP
jgi:hypothetical protein